MEFPSEDEHGMRAHAKKLFAELNAVLPPRAKDDDEMDDGWVDVEDGEGEDEDKDEDMEE